MAGRAPPDIAPMFSVDTKVEAAECPAGCPALPETSYWLGRSNEMGPVNRFLIIVNVGTVNTLRNQQF
jgi:hypothetical protein